MAHAALAQRYNLMVVQGTTSSLLLIALLFCGTGRAVAADFTYRWTVQSPANRAGFFPSIAFHPMIPSTILVSGDDSSGLYRSTDTAATFSLVTSVPPDESSYALRYDPTNPKTIYFPNHFGRPLLKSSDGGASWFTNQSSNGLPTGVNEHRLNDLAIDPTFSKFVWVAMESGLFRSANYGATFVRVVSAAFPADDFTSLAFSTDGNALVVGDAKGRFYDCHAPTQDPPQFRELSSATFTGTISDMQFSAHALYIAYNGGIVLRMALPLTPLAVAFINDGTHFTSFLYVSLAIVSGTSPTVDTVYAGSWIQPSAAWPQTNFGVFKSTDSGASWKRASEGLGGASVFSLAVSPHDPHLLIMGGVGSGIFVSRDAAATWHPVGGNRIFAVAGLAHAESPGDSKSEFVQVL